MVVSGLIDDSFAYRSPVRDMGEHEPIPWGRLFLPPNGVTRHLCEFKVFFMSNAEHPTVSPEVHTVVD